jgi:hypothetical protein
LKERKDVSRRGKIDGIEHTHPICYTKFRVVKDLWTQRNLLQSVGGVRSRILKDRQAGLPRVISVKVR